MKAATRTAVILLSWYKKILSPVFFFLGARCRHLPTCSDYAMDAYRLHGFWPGSWMTLARLCRCHPLGSHGFDPVPPKITHHSFSPWRYGRWRWSLTTATHKVADKPALGEKAPSSCLSPDQDGGQK